jgi:hypothetical protein
MRVKLHELRGRSATWAFAPGNGPTRLRQHGTLFSFSQKNSRCEFFCEKDLFASALPEAKCSFG